jgi:single-stranded-DNA-specific exonuclease
MPPTQIKTRSESVPPDLLTAFPPLIAQLYANRGVSSLDEVPRKLDALPHFECLFGIQDAVELLFRHLAAQHTITIVGDYDADGATSTSVLTLGLSMMGAKNVNYVVPNRFEYGYGLSVPIVELILAQQQSTSLIITVDNGISSIDGVAFAKEQGLDVLITDHHLPGAELPKADAILNPNQPECEFPSKALAGVGVVFYFLIALRRSLESKGWFESEQLKAPNLGQLLDLVALGTVADVVPLDPINRLLVHQGLQRIRAGRGRPLINALIELSKKSYAQVSAQDIAFGIAPKLNAAGRLDDMGLGIDGLVTRDEQKAQLIAAQLDDLNSERKAIEKSMQVEAEQVLNQLELGDNLPNGVCIFEPSWHQGVVGLLASRIKDKYHRPVVAFAEGDDGTLKGSARSIEGLHIKDAFELIASRHPGLILKFGGHAMAAGLSIDSSNYHAFKHAFELITDELLADTKLERIFWTDGELDVEQLTIETAEQIYHAGPWGQAFPEPLFRGRFEVIQQRIVGANHLKLVLSPDHGRTLIDAIWFNANRATVEKQVEVVYSLDINEYRGRRSLQLMVRHLVELR